MATALVDFLFPAPAAPATTAIIRWWEGRRFGYNIIVGSAGAFSWCVSSLMGLLMGKGVVPWQAVLVFGLAANFCYLFGPTAEILLRLIFGRRILPPSPTLFRMGLTFSVGLALLPILLMSFTSFVLIAKFLISG